MEEIKNQLIEHLKAGSAFTPVDKFIELISFEKLFERPDKLPYSFYELFYHMRFAQKDILDYLKNENYKEHTWPQDYWPKGNSLNSPEDWELLKSHFFEEQQELIAFLQEAKNDPLNPVNSETKNTLLREILLVIEHNAYHTGQLLIVLRSLGLYPA